jgi:hypothetical protein
VSRNPVDQLISAWVSPKGRTEETRPATTDGTSGDPTTSTSAPFAVCRTWYSEIRGSVPST